MYIMGNSEQLASKSKMWGTIIEELSEAGNIGTGWPLVCANHPHMTRTVDKPDQMRLYSPEGELRLLLQTKLSLTRQAGVFSLGE